MWYPIALTQQQITLMKKQIGCLLLASSLVLAVTGCKSSDHPAQLQSNIAPNATGQTHSLLLNLEPALDAFEVDCGRFPTTDEGLSALLKNPGIQAWHGPYCDSSLALTDEWGTPLRYQQDNIGLTLRSAGPDKVFQTTDDLVAIKKWQPDEKWQ